MGDRTSMTIQVCAPREYISLIAQYIELDDRSPSEEEEPNATDVTFTIEEIYVGSANEIACKLDKLMAEGDEDAELPPWPFAYYLWEDPKYEWLGSLYVRVPLPEGGYLDFDADCDADGNPVAKPDAILHVVDGATTLEEVREKVGALVGKRARELWERYEATSLPEQLTIEQL